MMPFGGYGIYGEHAVVNHGVGACGLLPSKPTPKWERGPPSTDGETVFLDSSSCRGAGEFMARCGINVHELAHYEARSVQWAYPGKTIDPDKVRNECSLPQWMANRIDRPKLEGVAAEVVNVCLDIVDERRMEAIIPGTHVQLRVSLLLAGAKLIDSLQYHDPASKAFGRGDKQQPEWRVALLYAILHWRLPLAVQSKWIDLTNLHWLMGYKAGDSSLTEAELNSFGIHVTGCIVDFRASELLALVEPLLKDCGTAKKVGTFKRSKRQWARIQDVCCKIFEFLAPYIPDPPDEGSGAASKNDPGKEMLVAGAKQAGENGESAGCTPDGHTISDEDFHRINELVRSNARSRFNVIAEELMASRDALVETGQADTGEELHDDWKELFLGGRMFSEETEDYGEQLNLAVLLDCSSSMDDSWVQVKSATVGACEAMEAHGTNVKAWRFSSVPHEHDDLSSLARAECGGGTSIVKTLSLAKAWLEQQEGKKILFVMTDGEVYDLPNAKEDFLIMINRGYGVVVVGINLSVETIRAHGWDAGIPVAAGTTEQFGTMIVDLMSRVAFE